MRQIAFYGKGGIGKSTTTSNISAALGQLGHRVMQIGCDPKADSTNTLTRGETIPNILDILRDTASKGGNGNNGHRINLQDLVFEGFKEICCCEAGGPEPGVGCAGRGIITAMELLKTHRAFEVYEPDFVFYDVLGDVVCGGFAMPIRKGLADEVYVITSGEKMALYACNNIFRGIEKFAKTGNTRVGGIIVNSRGTAHEVDLIEDFAIKTETKVVHVIPRDKIVQKSEMLGMTTIEHDVDSAQARSYLALGEKLVNNPTRGVPKAMSPQAFNAWARSHSEYF